MKKIFLILSFIAFAIMPALSYAQNITTIAGCGIGDDSLSVNAELVSPVGITFDTAGNAYIVDAGSYRVRKVDVSGVITTIAGNGVAGYSGDGGPATAAHLGVMYGIAVDKQGNVYIVDAGNNVIRKINSSGIISTVAGTGVVGFFGDGGPATAARLNQPIDIVLDTAGNIYFTDWLNNRVRKINTSGIITTVVGNGGTAGGGNNGPATASSLGRPFRVAMDKQGNLYVAAVLFQCITRVDTAGDIHIIADTTGTYNIGTDGDGGPAMHALMTSPCGLAVDTSGNIYFSDIGNDRIRKIDGATGIVSDYAANAPAGFSGDGGPATAAKICTPEGLALDRNGNLYICDADNNRIRKVGTGGIMSTFAGRNALFGEGYTATNAEMCIPNNLTTDAAGNIYVADAYNNRIRKIDAATGNITTVAGSGIAGYDDGFNGDHIPALSANIYLPLAVTFDVTGNMYIADANNNRVRKVSVTDTITTIAGNGTGGYNGDGGPAIFAQLNTPTGVAVDAAGNVYIADQGNSRIRKVNTSGFISTVAGVGIAGYNGDGILATLAKLNYPYDVAVDGMGNLYVADISNNRIRKIDTAGMISSPVGTGLPGFSGDGGLATLAQLQYPSGVKADIYGNIFIADRGNQRVRMVNTAGVITTVAGTGTAGFSGDGGPAVSAMLNNPTGVAVDMSGNMYIADGSNFRVRKLTLPLSVPQTKATLNNVSVYPNPAHDYIVIEATGQNIDLKISLFDMLGKNVLNSGMTSVRQTLDIAGLTNGVYMMQITGPGGARTTVKVVKE